MEINLNILKHIFLKSEKYVTIIENILSWKLITILYRLMITE